MLLSVDPGLRGSGCALWRDGILARAAYVTGDKTAERAPAWTAMVDAVLSWVDDATLGSMLYEQDTLAVEWQKVYAGRQAKGDPQDLLNLSAITGGLCWAFRKAKTRVYLPSEHRGQVPKNIAVERAKGRLTAEEHARVKLPTAKSLQHNVWDGIAIGLVHLKRM